MQFMPHIFLDESGQFTKNAKEKYFVIGSFTVGEPRRTAKRFRAWCQTKFPRRLRALSEIKFSSSGINDNLRLRTVQYIAKLDVRIHYTYLQCDNIPPEFREKTTLQSGLLYTQLVGEALELYLPSIDTLMHIWCDQRRLKGISKKDFVENLKARILPEMPRRATVKIETVDSSAFPNIQIADWAVGALAAHLNGKPLGEQYYWRLKNNIVKERELFKDHWQNNFGKQKTQSYD